jgi:hypothetical protein
MWFGVVERDRRLDDAVFKILLLWSMSSSAIGGTWRLVLAGLVRLLLLLLLRLSGLPPRRSATRPNLEAVGAGRPRHLAQCLIDSVSKAVRSHHGKSIAGRIPVLPTANERNRVESRLG